MNITSFSLLKSLFDGQTVNENELYSETLYMVLAGASRADLNVEAVETASIIKILKTLLDQDFTPQEIRLAAETELRKIAPIEKYVAKASKCLTVEHRQTVLYAMIDVFESDGYMGPLETDYFNTIANALNLTPAEILKR